MRRRKRRAGTRLRPTTTRHSPVVRATTVAIARDVDGKKYGPESPAGSRAACRHAKYSAAASELEPIVTRYGPRRKTTITWSGAGRTATAPVTRRRPGRSLRSARRTTVPRPTAANSSNGIRSSSTTANTVGATKARTRVVWRSFSTSMMRSLRAIARSPLRPVGTVDRGISSRPKPGAR